MTEYSYLSMRGVSKYYPLSGVHANVQVDFNVEKGEIHALVGENGAGKTTLVKILNGIEKPDSGEIIFNGHTISLNSPLDAEKFNIGMVHQHFRLFKEFTVAQNIVMGKEPVKGLLFNNKKAEKDTRVIIEENNFNISPNTKVADLSISQMQQAEILRILYNKADLLVLDEPTSVLTEQEVKKLFITLRKLRDLGKTIILITHKLSEVMDISDRITIMRKGRNVAVMKTNEVLEGDLSKLMVGREISTCYEKNELIESRPVLEIKNISLEKKGQEEFILKNLSFTVTTGEIVGITGAAGNGLRELEDIISGFLQPTSGNILHDQEDITHFSIKELRQRGFSYVPADRLHRGASLESSVTENFMVTDDGNKGKINELLERYGVEASADAQIGTLSGGNIQKVILGRELELAKDIVLFSEPAWGLDIISSEYIYRKILDMRSSGAAVILISSNLDEILKLSDRIIVMYRGKIVSKHDNVEMNKEILGEYMLGLKDDFFEN
ncbi:MAG: ABC transporter ATP-binding protein [Spirochaetales bacterium]|nr:ABC transporter ATP-binding protein [Spirochaetales bacterium]